MTDSITSTTDTSKASPQQSDDTELITSQGKTTIADAVVSKIAGIAARDVSGVHDLGGGAAKAVGAIRERISGAAPNPSQGVTVEVGERQAAIDLHLTAEYGVAIQDLAAAVRRNVIASIERMTGLEVSEVNIEVDDVYLETESSDGQSEDQAPRVQ